MSVQISRDEWMRALGDAVAPTDPDAATVRELADEFGITYGHAGKHVRMLVKEGRAIRTVKVVRLTDGQTRRITAYRLVSATKAAKSKRR